MTNKKAQKKMDKKDHGGMNKAAKIIKGGGSVLLSAFAVLKIIPKFIKKS